MLFRSPADLGQHPDGTPPTPDELARPATGATRAQALRTPFFWVVVSGVAASGMLSTAVAFHQVALLGERGLTPVEAAANFLPQTVAGLAATLAMGAAVDRFSPRWLTSAAMLTLAAGLLWGTVVAPGWSALGYGAAIGAAGGAIRSLEAASFPRVFGTVHRSEERRVGKECLL